MDIGQRLKIARKTIGYTLKKASLGSGISEPSLCAFEKGEREPRISYLSKLAEVYKKNIEFFLTDEPIIEDLMLWRNEPDTDEERKKTEAEFRQLCEQYHRLEVITDEVKSVNLPYVDVKSQDFEYSHANRLAEKVQKDFLLGDIPSMSLKQTLEEKYYVKIFHSPFNGSAISIFSQDFGPAILLNKSNKQWRRNFDLAHELFHLLTWNIFRTPDSENDKPSEHEEKLANVFASRLLLPTDFVKAKVESSANEKGQISFKALDEIAREFGVSLEALFWRLPYLFNNISAKTIESCISKAKEINVSRPPRKSDDPDELPERYCSLAMRALNEGRLSLIQFAKYMRIGYKKAQEYLTEDEEFTDEKVFISVA